MDLIDFYGAFHPKEAKYTPFSNAHGSFSMTDHVVGHKTSLEKFKKIEIISSIFSWFMWHNYFVIYVVSYFNIPFY